MMSIYPTIQPITSLGQVPRGGEVKKYQVQKKTYAKLARWIEHLTPSFHAANRGAQAIVS
jgi:hypothetical protein